MHCMHTLDGAGSHATDLWPFFLSSVVYRAGDCSSFLGVILKGEVAVLSSSPVAGGSASLGEMDRVASLTASDAFGAGSLVDSSPRATTVVCMVECEIAVLTRRDYLEVLMRRHDDDADSSSIDAPHEEDQPPMSLLDPAFAAASALPSGLELTPHLQAYIDILTAQSQSAVALEERRLASETPGADPALGPSHHRTRSLLCRAASATSATLLARAAVLAAPTAPPASSDTMILYNLLKTCRALQMHDSRPAVLALTEHLTLHQYPPHTVLYEAGDVATHTYFVLAGSVAEMNTNSFAHRDRARAQRRSKRAAVRSMIARWDEADRRAAEEARRRKEQQPHYMSRTAQTENALRENAPLIAQVQFSVAAQEKDAERRERTRLAREARQAQVDALMHEYDIPTLDSSEDEEEASLKRRHATRPSAPNTADAATAATSSAAAPQPHQFPFGSCQTVRLYPEHVGWSDVESHLHSLQESYLSSQVASSAEFASREVERGAIIEAAAQKGLNMGSGLQAAQAANAVIEEAQRELEHMAARREAMRAAVHAERAARMSHKTADKMAAARRAVKAPTRTTRTPSPEKRTPVTSPTHATSPVAAGGGATRTAASATPLYLSPTFSEVTYTRSCVARESCWVARISNAALLAAVESPYHGSGVVERLNDPVLRYTALRAQDASNLTTEPNDPDARFAHQSSKSIGQTETSGVRLDYSHHIDSLFMSMRHLRFFSIQNRELGLRLCARMQYLRLNKGDILCKQGQQGSLFYIIMSGTVSIHIKPQYSLPQLTQAINDAAEAREQKATRRRNKTADVTPDRPTKDTAAVQGNKEDSPLLVGEAATPDSPPPPSVATSLARRGSALVQSLMFPTSSPMEQVKQQQREDEEVEQQSAAADADSKRTTPRASAKHGRTGSVVVQSLMFPTSSPMGLLKPNPRDEEELASRKSRHTPIPFELGRLPHILDSFTPSLSSFSDPPSVLARHLAQVNSSVVDLTQIDSLYGPCVKVAVSGDPIGESAIVSSNPRSATCICREPVELFTLSKADYRAIYAVPQYLKVNTIIKLVRQTQAPERPISTANTTHPQAPVVGSTALAPPRDDGTSRALSTNDVLLLEHCIRNIEVLKPLHPTIRTILGQRLHHLQLEGGRVVYEQGQRGHYLYIIISGTCSAYMKPAASTPTIAPKKTPNSKRATLSLMPPIIPKSPATPTRSSTPAPLACDSATSSTTHSPRADTAHRPPLSPSVEPTKTQQSQGLKAENLSRLQAAAVGLLSSSPRGTRTQHDSPVGSSRVHMDRAHPDQVADPGTHELDTQGTLDTASLSKEAHDAIDAIESRDGSGQSTPLRGGHRRSHRTVSGAARTMAALETSTVRPGTEMLTSSGPKAFKFSAGATVASAAGGGRAFSAGRIRPAHLESYPPVTDINLSEQESAYLQGLGPVTSILSVGNSFGDTALQSTGPGLHTSTVVTNGPTDLLLLTRASYQFAVESLAQWKSDLDEVYAFIKSSHFFANWSPTTIAAAMNLMERREIKRNEVIIRQGDRASHIFFVIKGEIHVTQSMQLVDAELPEVAHPSAVALERITSLNAAAASSTSSPKRRRADHRDPLDMTIELEAPPEARARARKPVTIQAILKEQRLDIESAAAAAAKSKSRSSGLPVPPSLPVRTSNGLVGSLLRPQFGLPLLVPSIPSEESVPLVASSTHLSNFTSLISASQLVGGLNPSMPVVDGGQLWVYWPQRNGYSYSTVSSGCKRRGAKKVYKHTSNNGTEITLGKKAAGGVLSTNPNPANATAGDATGPVGFGANASADSALPSSPIFPFTLELASLSHNGVCGNLETLLPTVLGVKDLLGRPDTEEEISRERERKEREAYAIEHGEMLPPPPTPMGAPAAAPSSATQCQLSYPSTYTAFTDCTLVAFPTNAFHTLLSVSEELEFFSLYRDRLEKSCERIRRWLEGRFLTSPPFTRELLEDFRVFEENLYYAAHKHAPEEARQRERLNALLRPGIKPPALMDHRTEDQLKELKAAGLDRHPYTINLEGRVKAQQSHATASLAATLPSDTSDGVVATPLASVSPPHPDAMSFSWTGNMADHRFSHVLSQYVPSGGIAHIKPRARQARHMLDTICQVSVANAASTSVPPAVAADHGHATFDPLKQRLPNATATHNAEFQAALKYAERSNSLRQRDRESAETNSRKEHAVIHSQSLPVLPRADRSTLPTSPVSATPSTVSLPATPQGSSTQELRLPVDATSPDSRARRSGSIDLNSSGDLDTLQVPAASTREFGLSPLSQSSHSDKFFAKSPAASRNPVAAAGMVTHLLYHAPHELEQFLSHVKKQQAEEAPEQRDEDGTPPRRRKKKHTASVSLTTHETEAMKQYAANVASAASAAQANAPPPPVTSTPQYALTSAVLALQSQTALHAQQTVSQQAAYSRHMVAQQRDRVVGSSRAQSRALAKALCLPDPFSSEVGAQFAAGHIKHLQRVVRGELPDTRATRTANQEEAKSPAMTPAATTTTMPLLQSATPEERTISPDSSGEWLYTPSPITSPVLSPMSSLAAFHRAHRLQSSSSLSPSRSMPSLGTSPHSLTRRVSGASTAAAVTFLHTSLSSQELDLVSGGSLSSESLHLGSGERVQQALREEEDIARYMGVDPDIVHAQAGHATTVAQRKHRHSSPPPQHRSAPAANPLFAPAAGAPVSALLGGYRVPQQRPSVGSVVSNESVPLHPTRTLGVSSPPPHTRTVVNLGNGISVHLPKIPSI